MDRNVVIATGSNEKRSLGNRDGTNDNGDGTNGNRDRTNDCALIVKFSPLRLIALFIITISIFRILWYNYLSKNAMK